MLSRRHVSIHMLKAMLSYFVLSIITLTLIFAFPGSKAGLKAYHVSENVYHVMIFLSALPSLLYWFTGFYAYAKMFEYAVSIEDTDERFIYRRIARGVQWLAFSQPVWLIVVYCVRSILNVSPGFFPTGWTIINYSQLALPLIGFMLIGSASGQLVRRSKQTFKLRDAKGCMAGLIIGSILYALLAWQLLDFSNFTSSHNAYGLPAGFILLTIVLPFLFTWYVGLRAAGELNSYGRHVRGLIYRPAMRLMDKGLVLVIASIIAFQWASSLALSSGYLKWGPGIVAIQIFSLARGFGFGLIALGVRRLKRIEEV